MDYKIRVTLMNEKVETFFITKQDSQIFFHSMGPGDPIPQDMLQKLIIYIHGCIDNKYFLTIVPCFEDEAQ